MDYDYCKRSGQIPAFGDWDYSNEMPITQYFECARQAGLIRYSSSSGDSDPYINGGCGADDLYAVDLKKPSRNINNAPRKTRVRNEKRGSQVKEQRKQAAGGKVFDVTEPPRKQPHHVPLSTDCINYNFNYNYNNTKLHRNGVVPPPTTRSRPPFARPPKAVDEDLYKIPPELLYSSKRKKMPGFFSCLVPACAS
ncbi:hypothetical protein Dsin_021343 [Dipteronia sinensis]|uniref:RIN4 pathogenic type III effector avirulence factor Avr cleavage site domain-containing protein n=1 Tax=Dipteronia sinensis TaxID=43782 RepID=A0AAD9ZZK6_9ROSI|nr:hypothetical protein Dsin_021343 [Dipteronia sinensis]